MVFCVSCTLFSNDNKALCINTSLHIPLLYPHQIYTTHQYTGLGVCIHKANFFLVLRSFTLKLFLRNFYYIKILNAPPPLQGFVPFMDILPLEFLFFRASFWLTLAGLEQRQTGFFLLTTLVLHWTSTSKNVTSTVPTHMATLVEVIWTACYHYQEFSSSYLHLARLSRCDTPDAYCVQLPDTNNVFQF